MHIKNEDLTVSHNGRGMLLNKTLMDRQNCWGNLDKIKALHKTRLILEETMASTDDPHILHALDLAYNELEYKLQENWGFTKDPKFFRFWERPKCRCPKLDNADNYPTGMCVISSDCPLHSPVKSKKKK